MDDTKKKNNNFIQFKRGPVARAKDTAFTLYTAHANTNPLINLLITPRLINLTQQILITSKSQNNKPYIYC